MQLSILQNMRKIETCQRPLKKKVFQYILNNENNAEDYNPEDNKDSKSYSHSFAVEGPAFSKSIGDGFHKIFTHAQSLEVK